MQRAAHAERPSPERDAARRGARDAGAPAVPAQTQPRKTITAEDRRAYWAAITLARKLTIAKTYDGAVEAFTRALAAIPDDGRALGERGYARFLAGEVDATRERDVYRVVYQAHRGTMSVGVCFCEDGDACGDGNPPCKCAEPTCPLVCGGADELEGPHIETFVDAKTGAACFASSSITPSSAR